MPAVRRQTLGTILISIAIHVAVLLFAAFCAYPFLLTLMVSITAESSIDVNGYRLVPASFSLEAYRYIFREGSRVVTAYRNSLIITASGTVGGIFITSMLAYVLANRDLKYRNAFTFFVFFTMIFNAGLVPWYLVVTGIGLRDNLLALIVPSLVGAWYVFLLRTFFRGIPDSIPESARIDGANEMTIYVRLILPLSVPGIASVGLFYAIGYWNDWWLALLLIGKRTELYPLQYLLRIIMSNIVNAMPAHIKMLRPDMEVPDDGIRMATMMVTIGPIILVYPFVQRYFVKGITIGAIKG